MRRSLVHALLWTAATLLGYLFTGIGTHFPGSFPVGSGVLDSLDPSAALVGLVIGGVGGGAIGTLQWLVLRSWIGVSWRWLVATALAVAVTHALGDGLPTSWEWPPLAIAGGSVMAGAQWMALADRMDRAPLSLTSGLVFAAGVISGVAIADPRSADWMTAHLVAAAVAGTVVAAGVGAAVLWTSRARWLHHEAA